MTILKNIGWLILVALPCFFLLVWTQALIGDAEGSQNISYSLETGIFYYLGSVLYVVLGGLVHQVLLLFLPNTWNQFKLRVIALLLTPVIPLLLILMGERTQTITDFLIPVILALGVYGLLISLPEAFINPKVK
jgi:hypothetical protein